MKVVYYFDHDLQYCPVKEYLSRYSLDCRIKSQIKNKNLNLLANIDAKINYVLANFGRPVAPISYSLDRNFNFLEIKQRKDKNILIRIFYCCYEDLLVLLACLEKPDNYDNRKTRQKIRRELELVQDFQDKFIANPKLYENYQ
ncbi:hypothetical protein JXE04_02345 [Patescibacteria group bacterium]|nr:hypothetical protein [Patescibacteria group bacterium]